MNFPVTDFTTHSLANNFGVEVAERTSQGLQQRGVESLVRYLPSSAYLCGMALLASGVALHFVTLLTVPDTLFAHGGDRDGHFKVTRRCLTLAPRAAEKSALLPGPTRANRLGT